MKRANRRDDILDAAFDALRTRGFAGTSTRIIAGIGGFNPALIFYYFDSLDDLLVAVLERASTERLRRYRPAVEETRTLQDLVQVLSRIYRDDLESGHIRVVSELVAASVSRSELAARVLTLMKPWVELAEAAVRRIVTGSPLEPLVRPGQLALAAVTFYLGANLLTHLQGADVEALLADAARAAPLLDAIGARMQSS